jgi:transmembrane sensor
MNSNDEQVRTAIAEQAGDWFVANDDGPLDARDCAALTGWLKASPVHVEAFLGVSALARYFREAGADPEYSLEAMLELARSDGDTAAVPLRPRIVTPVRAAFPRRWLSAAVAAAACVVLSLGVFLAWDRKPTAQLSDAGRAAALHLETRHGEQLSHRLSDGSVLHLNTDSAVTIRYARTERLVTLTSGQADFEVAHEPERAFRVLAGSAEVVAVGTRFDVRLEQGATVVTVVEGRVAVGPAPRPAGRASQPDEPGARRSVQVAADQQIRVIEGQWQGTPATVDAQRVTAWLRRKIVFDQEPLERVAAEFNRYAPKPFEIATPALQKLEISGAFASNDTEAFIAFLRSLKGVRVEITATKIRVSQDPRTAAPGFT